MFRMRQGVVEATDTAEAIRLLGWGTCVAGPVAFSSVRFWAGIRVDSGEHERRRQVGMGPVLARDVLAGHIGSGMGPGTLRPAVRLLGCLVAGDNAAAATRGASLFAGYASRAVLIRDKEDLTALTVNAALLDQGVVVSRDGRLQLLAEAGPRVPGHGFDAREWELLETVYAAWLGNMLSATADCPERPTASR
jgi:hypothetical protein